MAEVGRVSVLHMANWHVGATEGAGWVGTNELAGAGNVRRWLRDPIDLDWMVGFVQRRGAGPLKAGAIVIGCVTLIVAIGMSLCCPAGEFPGPVRVVMWASLPVLVGATVRWALIPIIPRAEAVAAVCVADAGVALASLTHQTRIAGVAGTALFALLGIFSIFYLSARWHLLQAAFAATVIAATVVLVGVFDGASALPLAISKAVGPLVITILALPFIHFYIWLLVDNTADSLIDPLTSVANRRGMLERLPGLAGPGGDIAVIVIDVDSFKAVNDSHGHAVGDEVLRRTAAHLVEAARSSGAPAVVARLGGEEFAIVTGTGLADALAIAEWAQTAISQVSQQPPITVSIGVAAGTGRRLDDFVRLLDTADAAMYSAKESGGARIALAPDVAA